ncbi:MAG: hypothetical protein ACRYFX_00695 [Janthinobacterium lividum]
MRAQDLPDVGSTRYGPLGTSRCVGTGGLRTQARAPSPTLAPST